MKAHAILKNKQNVSIFNTKSKPKFNWEHVQWKTHREETQEYIYLKNEEWKLKNKNLIVKKLRRNNIDVNIIYS